MKRKLGQSKRSVSYLRVRAGKSFSIILGPLKFTNFAVTQGYTKEIKLKHVSK